MENRALKILSAIVDDYIKSGEPVGSKTLADKLDIKVSSATIRNEMAVLEQLGLLEHTHTSAGRIPTYKGFRLYIDQLMNVTSLDRIERLKIDEMLSNQAHTQQEVLQTASTALSEITGYASVFSRANSNFSVITKVEVIPTGHRLYVLLLITSSGAVKNRMCRLEFDLNPEQMEFFTSFVNQNLQGINAEALSETDLQKLVFSLGSYMVTLSPLLKAVYELSSEVAESKFVIKNEQKLLTSGDFNPAEVIRFLESRNELSQMLDAAFSGIKVFLSKETDTFVISNSSLILGGFEHDGVEVGKLGVVGPMRLDYKKVIPYIDYFSSKVTQMLSEVDEKIELQKIEKEQKEAER